ncbi:MAG TPA: phage holin family protein [Kineosporiaceae bacterium]|nr:phage holin family protein [Kineosporiaceae bacterium]
MRGIITKVVINAVAIWIATLVVPKVEVHASSLGNRILTLLVVGALFGLINTFLKPVVKLFTLPLYLLTLGLISFVVNALMLKVVEWLSGRIGISFDAGPFFWSTLGAAVVITFVSMILNVTVPDGD